MYTLMTNDVEHTSIVQNTLSKQAANLVYESGIPKLLSLYSKNDIRATFYFTGEYANQFPSSVDLVKDHGHEIGCHGYSHKVEHSFDILTQKEQFLHLKLAKKTIESIAGKIESFRAPALRLGNYTPAILEKVGFRTDSSIAPQRFDGPLTFGSLRKLRWMTAKRNPYFLDKINPFKSGKSKVLEIPVSSAIFAYQGTTMRVSPNINKLVGDYLHHESSRGNKPIVFLFHPNEAIEETVEPNYELRGQSFLSRLFADKLRRRLKLRNLGSKSIKLLQEVIDKSKEEGHEFVSASDYRQLHSQLYSSNY